MKSHAPVRTFLHAAVTIGAGLSFAVAHVTAAGAAGMPVATSRADDASVEDYLQERMEATKTPGMAYAIVTPDSIGHIGAWGDDGNGDPITADTPFLWGSVSKPVTATAVMTLVERGAISLDEPVHTYLPNFTMADDAARDITVRHLLQHTSGIPEATGVTDRFDVRSDPYDDAVAHLAGVALQSAPGSEHEYSSTNFLVLGALVETVSGQPFDDYLREHVTAPLAMSTTVASKEAADANLADGHSYAFGQPITVPARYDQTGPSYGYVGGSVRDLAHFAIAHLNHGRLGSATVLNADSVDLMHSGTARVSDTQRYGLGWRDDDRNADYGTRTVWHGGAVQGYQAMIVLLPELDRGIVVLQNIYGVFQDTDLVAAGLGAARLLAGGEPSTMSSGITYPATLAALSVVCAAVAVAVGWTIRRVFRRNSSRISRRRVLLGIVGWTIAGSGLAYLAAILLPQAFGTSLRLIPLWAPDVGWLLIAISIGALMLVATNLTTSMVQLRRRVPRTFSDSA